MRTKLFIGVACCISVAALLTAIFALRRSDTTNETATAKTIVFVYAADDTHCFPVKAFASDDAAKASSAAKAFVAAEMKLISAIRDKVSMKEYQWEQDNPAPELPPRLANAPKIDEAVERNKWALQEDHDRWTEAWTMQYGEDYRRSVKQWIANRDAYAKQLAANLAKGQQHLAGMEILQVHYEIRELQLEEAKGATEIVTLSADTSNTGPLD